MGFGTRLRFAAVVSACAIGTLLALPLGASGDSNGLLKNLRGTVDNVTSGVLGRQGTTRPAPAPARRPVAGVQQRQSAPRQDEGEPTYQPPLHGTNPHGQGTVSSLDVNEAILGPVTRQDESSQELVVLGRSRGEKQTDGSYHGKVTLVSFNLLGVPIEVAIETAPGESESGALGAADLQDLCDATQGFICAQLLEADSATTAKSSNNSFRVVGLESDDFAFASVGESHGNISEDSNCQTSHGDASLVQASLLTSGTTTVGQSSTDSKRCRDGTSTQTNDSSLLSLFDGDMVRQNTDEECADGTPDVFFGIPGLIEFFCNADDTNGVGEPAVQGPLPYGVREALTTRLLVDPETGESLAKYTTSASESRADPPPAPPETPETPQTPQTPTAPTTPVTTPDEGEEPDTDQGDKEPTKRGVGNENASGGQPNTVRTATATSKLPFTGSNLLIVVLVGAVTFLLGASVWRASSRIRPSA